MCAKGLVARSEAGYGYLSSPHSVAKITIYIVSIEIWGVLASI
jgi:hypothetical protein